MESTRFKVAALSALLTFAVGCGDDGPSGTPDMGVNDPYALEVGDANGAVDPATVPAGEARAGRIDTADLPTDPSGLATWAGGDFLLANERVGILVEDIGESELYNPWGGQLVGIARNESGSLVDAADFNELMFGVGRFTINPSSVTVLNDGTDGGTAIVRVIASLRPIPFVDSLAGAAFAANYNDIDVAVDYELAPGNDHLDVFFTFNVRREVEVGFIPHTFLAIQTSRMPSYFEGRGFNPASGQADFMGYVTEDSTSWAVSVPGETMNLAIAVSGVQILDITTARRYSLPAEAQTRRQMARIYVGAEGDGLDGLRRSVARSEGTNARLVTGRIENSDGSAALGARVHVLTADGTGYITRAAVDSSGNYEVSVPDGAFELHVFRDGDGVATPVALAAGATTADTLTFPASGFIHVTAQTMEPGAGAAAPAPVRMQIIEIDGGGTPQSVPRPGTASVPFSAFGEIPIPDPERWHVEFPLTGEATMRVPVGTYRVVVSRGYEYDIFDDAAVVVTAGATTNVAPVLNRDVDTTDVLCGDFHIHTDRSPDSEDSAAAKLTYALGDGIELPVRTDHEHVTAFDPVVAAANMEAWAFGVSAVEFTTFDYGHFGVFPLEPDASRVNHGAPIWRDTTVEDPATGLARLVPAPEVFTEVRGRAGSPEVILFHPRGSGAGFSYFDAVDYDPTTGQVSNPDLYDEDAFGIVEVFNETSFAENLSGSVQDWFSFLNRGKAVTAVGSSDSHNVRRGSPVGYPRTCVTVGTDSPNDFRSTFDSSDLRDDVLAGRVTISGGIFVTAIASGGVTPGGTVSNASATEQVTVVVQAPQWVPVAELEVYINGVLDDTIDISGGGPVIRHSAVLNITVPTGDSTVVFHARGPVDGDGVETSDLSPVHPGHAPFGVTNPIYFSR